jgi:NAD(P)-dependent dehydrogenase (short-subunit alcohol dehydrogenase family)
VPDLAQTALRGRVALVTGGARGIGKAIVAALQAAGAKVALTARDPAAARSAAAALPGALGIACEVSDAASARDSVAAAVAHFGSLDILVNNAGVAAKPAPIEAVEEADWDRVVAVDLKGPFLLARAAVPHMKAAGWGRIVNIGSTAREQTAAPVLAYAAAKGGLAALTRLLALELAPAGITVNAVHPGPTETEMWKRNVAPERRREIAGLMPMGRVAKPGEIAALVAFLCTEGAAFVTGENIAVAGGWPGRVPRP